VYGTVIVELPPLVTVIALGEVFTDAVIVNVVALATANT
jgi:hypothetical protein